MIQRGGNEAPPAESSTRPATRQRVRTPARSVAHEEALADAYLVLELAQADAPVGPDEPGGPDTHIAALRRRAHEHGWTDVAFVVEYARWSRAIVTEQDVSELQETIESLARQSGDNSLVAVVLASRAQLGWSGHEKYAVGADADVARAVALLQDGGGDLVHRPTGWVACALAYAYCGMRDLELDMHERALADLSRPWSGALDRIRVTTLHAVSANRIESTTEQVAALFERGERDAAAVAAQEGIGSLRADLADLPAPWVEEYRCLLHLLEAIAGAPASAALESVLDQVTGSPWPGFAACARLGEAVRAADDGRAEAAAAVAVEVAAAMHPDLIPGIRMLALSIGARQSGLGPAAQLYVNELLTVHASGQRRAIEAARSRQVAERVHRENQVLSERAYVDELTGLANRHVYTRALERLRLRGSRNLTTVLLLDIDHFKAVNDTFGHAVGDEVLRRCATELTLHSRPTDLVARLGGDEFVIVRDAGDLAEMRRRAEALVVRLGTQPWHEVHPDLSVTLSAGMTTGPSADIDALLERADSALYRAKAGGRARLETATDLDDDSVSGGARESHRA